jgi:hypothetical protein
MHAHTVALVRDTSAQVELVASAAAVGKLDDLPALVPVLQGLTERHRDCGVQATPTETAR